MEGGSALGAERHKGIIPWDDDFDIAVHGDYESLLINEIADDLCKVFLHLIIIYALIFKMHIFYKLIRTFSIQLQIIVSHGSRMRVAGITNSITQSTQLSYLHSKMNRIHGDIHSQIFSFLKNIQDFIF